MQTDFQQYLIGTVFEMLPHLAGDSSPTQQRGTDPFVLGTEDVARLEVPEVALPFTLPQTLEDNGIESDHSKAWQEEGEDGRDHNEVRVREFTMLKIWAPSFSFR